MRDSDHGQCLTEETLTEYLEGGLDPAFKTVTEVHLVSCGQCRDQLAFFMRVLNPEVRPEETRILEVVSVEWDKRGHVARSQRRGFSLSRVFITLSVIAAILVLGVLTVRVVRQRAAVPRSADDVVRLLLEHNRPFESRLAGEPHWPIVRTRGVTQPSVSYGLLGGEMTRLSANSHEMGRFYLLQKEFDRAVPYLEMAEREVGSAAAVHNDLGVAYLEGGDRFQLEKAGLEFSHAIQRDGLFAAAVFNLALFYERTNAPAQAEMQWKRYLELDSTSEWAREARGRLPGLTH